MSPTARNHWSSLPNRNGSSDLDPRNLTSSTALINVSNSTRTSVKDSNHRKPVASPLLFQMNKKGSIIHPKFTNTIAQNCPKKLKTLNKPKDEHPKTILLPWILFSPRQIIIFPVYSHRSEEYPIDQIIQVIFHSNYSRSNQPLPSPKIRRLNCLAWPIALPSRYRIPRFVSPNRDAAIFKRFSAA